ncbi:MAG: NAD-dependent epimerase/dehydratase family protein [Actinomycetota bacterium]
MNIDWNDPTELHVIVGAGATGSATAELLAEQGAKVRIITRSGSGPAHPAIERVAADATDVERLTELTVGAAALYNCANPPYHRWATDWPPLASSLLRAAERTGAVLVTLSNLYGYAPDGPMHPGQPLNPPSEKGAIRAGMWHDARAEHEAGRVRVTEARASDFIGAGLGDTSHFGDRLLNRILAGKSVQVFGATDVEHSWTAVSDVARTLVTLARDERAWGRAWHVPTAPARTQREMVERLCDAAGTKRVKVSVLPMPLIKLLGIFIKPLGEMPSVAYQFTEPFVVDASETTEVFGLEATPLAETIDAMVGGDRVKAAVSG